MPSWWPHRGRSPTVGESLDAGDTIRVFCWNRACQREGELDLLALAKKFGRDVTLESVRRALVCSECGSPHFSGKREPNRGEHRLLASLACTKNITPNLGHIFTGRADKLAPEIFKKRRARKRDFIPDEDATMCGRFSIKDEPSRYKANLRLLITPNWAPRYNVCPTQDVPVARPASGGMDVTMMRWGLIPSWVRSHQGPPLINARSETIEKMPAWRDAFKKRRCLMMGDGYYEWTGEKSPKQPWYITLKNGGPFAFAALWETWKNPKGETVLSTAMATTTATDSLAFIHDRMPVLLTDHAEQDAWLDPATPVAQLKALLRPYPSDRMEAFKVGRAVSNVRVDSEECISPLSESNSA